MYWSVCSTYSFQVDYELSCLNKNQPPEQKLKLLHPLWNKCRKSSEQQDTRQLVSFVKPEKHCIFLCVWVHECLIIYMHIWNCVSGHMLHNVSAFTDKEDVFFLRHCITQYSDMCSKLMCLWNKTSCLFT